MSSRVAFDAFALLACALMAGMVSVQHGRRLGAATLVGVVASVGGGTLRDILLERLPVFWVREPWQIVLAFAASIGAYVVCRGRTIAENDLLWPDAFALATPAVIGARVALEAGHNLVVAAVIAMAAGVFGGILRDTLCDRAPAIFKKEFYGLAALAGGVIVCIGDAFSWPMAFSVSTGLIAAAVMRIAAVRWKLSCD